MTTIKKFIFSCSWMIALSILIFSTSCFTYKRVAFTSANSSAQAELISKLAPEKKYSFELEGGENVFMKIKTVTPDTIFGDVERINVTKVSRITGLTNTYTFKNVSINGEPKNFDWPWGDPNTRLIGLGRVNTKSINRVSELKFSPGTTIVMMVIPLAIVVLIVGTLPITYSGGI